MKLRHVSTLVALPVVALFFLPASALAGPVRLGSSFGMTLPPPSQISQQKPMTFNGISVIEQNFIPNSDSDSTVFVFQVSASNALDFSSFTITGLLNSISNEGVLECDSGSSGMEDGILCTGSTNSFISHESDIEGADQASVVFSLSSSGNGTGLTFFVEEEDNSGHGTPSQPGGNFNLSSTTPEPSSLVLLASGLAFLGGFARRKLGV